MRLLLLLLLLPIITIPSAFGQVVETVGENYDLVENFDTLEAKWSSFPDRMLDEDGSWANYILSETDEKVIFNSNSIGGLVYDINSCSYSIYENGYVSPETNIIPSVSAVATYLNNGQWQNLPINNEACNVLVEPYNDGVLLTSTKLLSDDIFIQELDMNVKTGFKETFKVTHDDIAHELGISQTVHIPNGEIKIADQIISIEEFNGMSYDKDFIVENRAEILQFTDTLNYDFSKGITSLENVNIIFDDFYKVNLDYANGNDGVPFVGYLEIDPTFTNSSPTSGRVISDWQSGSSCNTTYNSADSYQNFQLKRNAINGGCNWAYWAWDLSSISSSAIISSATFGLDVTAYGDIDSVVEAKDCQWLYSDDNTASAGMFSDFINNPK